MAPKVLLTGANGFLGTHMLRLLTEDYDVTAVARSASKAEDVLTPNDNWNYFGKIRTVIVPDFTVPGAFNDVFKNNSFDYVVHTAAPMPRRSGPDLQTDYLDPSIKGNLSLLEAIKLHGPTVKHITITGTIGSAAANPLPPGLSGISIDQDSWAGWTIEKALASSHPMAFYLIAKELSEKAVWKWLDGNKDLHFSISVILSTGIFGPPMQKIRDRSSLDAASGFVYGLIDSSVSEREVATLVQAYIDVRDLAELHIQALTNENAANHRFIAGTKSMSFTQAVKIIGEHYPSLKPRLAKSIRPEPPLHTIDGSKTDMVFPHRYRTLEQTISDTIERLLQVDELLRSPMKTE